MGLTESVAELERDADTLEAKCLYREREVRAPVVAAEADLSGLEAAVAQEEARLAQFTAELAARPRVPALTLPRSVFAAVSMGAFCWGAFAGGLDVTRVSVGLFAGVWVVFLAGALRGR